MKHLVSRFPPMEWKPETKYPRWKRNCNEMETMAVFGNELETKLSQSLKQRNENGCY